VDNHHKRTLVTKLAMNTILLGEEKEKGLYLSVDLFLVLIRTTIHHAGKFLFILVIGDMTNESQNKWDVKAEQEMDVFCMG